MDHKVILQINETETQQLTVPGATPDGIARKVFNLDADKGMTAIVIVMAPGSHIPAHYHKKGAEAHYVLSGEMIENGQPLGPGTFLTHTANTVHGPHETKTGCSILTFQEAYVDPADPDFYIAED